MIKSGFWVILLIMDGMYIYIRYFHIFQFKHNDFPLYPTIKKNGFQAPISLLHQPQFIFLSDVFCVIRGKIAP